MTQHLPSSLGAAGETFPQLQPRISSSSMEMKARAPFCLSPLPGHQRDTFGLGTPLSNGLSKQMSGKWGAVPMGFLRASHPQPPTSSMDQNIVPTASGTMQRAEWRRNHTMTWGAFRQTIPPQPHGCLVPPALQHSQAGPQSPSQLIPTGTSSALCCGLFAGTTHREALAHRRAVGSTLALEGWGDRRMMDRRGCSWGCSTTERLFIS